LLPRSPRLLRPVLLIERLPKEHLDDRLPAHVQLRSGTVQLLEHVRGAMDVDPLGKQATCVNEQGGLRVYAKDLEDGSKDLGRFNGRFEAKVAPHGVVLLRMRPAGG
jgi:hypothetical protein